MRPLFCLILLIAMLGARSDGFTNYGAYFFNRIRETDQIAVIRLEPKRVTLDMFISIDGIPRNQTVTYILPFWHQPQGFKLEQMTNDDFRKQQITPLSTQFAAEIRLANHTAADTTTKSYLLGGCLTFPPLLPIALCTFIFPTFASHHSLPPKPYDTQQVPFGSAELYHLSTEQSLQALVAKAGLPAKYARVLKHYQTNYYAVMRLHGPEMTPALKAGIDAFVKAGGVFHLGEGLHFHFTHLTAGETYTYTYPLGTGGAWAQPIDFTEIYTSCPPDYYLTATAPKIGRELTAMEMHAENARSAQKTYHAQAAFSSYLTPMRYPTAWHRAYLMSNPREDITLRLDRKPNDPLYTYAARLRNSDWVALPGIFLSFFLAVWLTAVFYIRRVWQKAGEPEALRHYRWLFIKFAAIPPLACSGAALLFYAGDYFPKLIALFGILLLGYLIAALFLLCRFWFVIIPEMEGHLPTGTLKRALWVCAGCYYLQFPIWCYFAAMLDKFVQG